MLGLFRGSNKSNWSRGTFTSKTGSWKYGLETIFMDIDPKDQMEVDGVRVQYINDSDYTSRPALFISLVSVRTNNRFKNIKITEEIPIYKQTIYRNVLKCPDCNYNTLTGIDGLWSCTNCTFKYRKESLKVLVQNGINLRKPDTLQFCATHDSNVEYNNVRWIDNFKWAYQNV